MIMGPNDWGLLVWRLSDMRGAADLIYAYLDEQKRGDVWLAPSIEDVIEIQRVSTQAIENLFPIISICTRILKEGERKGDL